jgi:hypothetical protein
VAVAALRAKGLRPVAVDDATVALRLLVDRRDGLGHAHTDLINRIHKLFAGATTGRGQEIPIRHAGPSIAQHDPST